MVLGKRSRSVGLFVPNKKRYTPYVPRMISRTSMLLARRRFAVVRGRGARGETKAVDVPNNVLTFAFPLNTAIASQSLTLVQVGAAFYNRIGSKIAMNSLYITADIQPANAVGVLSEETLRYIIFYDKQPNKAAAVWTDLVQAVDNAAGVTNTVYDGFNMDNRDRFVVLRDRKIVMPRTSATGVVIGPPYGTSCGSVGAESGSDGGTFVKEFIKLGKIEAQFSGTANPATVAQIVTGNLAIIFQGNVGGQYVFTGSSRLRFTDF